MSKINKNIIYLDRFIEIVPLDQLPQTEQVVCEEKVESLATTLLSRGTFPTPITAVRDPKSGRILPLDGNHRRMGGEKIGLKYLPVIFVAWEEFKIGVWKHAVKINRTENLEALFIKSGIIKGNNDESSDQALFYFNGDSYIFERHSTSKLEAHDWAHQFLNELAETGAYIENSAKSDNRAEDLKNEQGFLVLELPCFSKSDLLSFLAKGIILPPKAYRTILPYGPIRLPIKLDWLKELKDLSNDKLKAINHDVQKELKAISFIELPNTIDVSENKKQFFAPLKLAPVTTKGKISFNIINFERLKKLRPLNLQNTFSRGIIARKQTRERLDILVNRLDVQLDINVESQQNQRITLHIGGPATMDMEAVFKLCNTDRDLEKGIDAILEKQEEILNSIKLSKHLIYLLNDDTHAHNLKHPHIPS